jgi:hypothetical protein
MFARVEQIIRNIEANWKAARLIPRSHYFQGFALGSAVFFGGVIAFVTAAFLPFGHDAPVLLQLVTWLGMPVSRGYVVAFLCSFGLSIAATLLILRLYCRWLPAQCPVCTGKTYAQAHWPVFYECRDCWHCHDPRIHEDEDSY